METFGDFDESPLATLAIDMEDRIILVVCVATYMDCRWILWPRFEP